MTKLTLEIKLPNELLQAILQHLRDFDTTHDPEHEDLIQLAIGIESDLKVDALQSIFNNVRPPFQHQFVYQAPGRA